MFQLVAWALYVHFVLFFSVFDIYFKSPVIHGMSPIKPSIDGPAKRLVLIVSDGLRADSIDYVLQNNHPTPFLRSLIENGNASWGISHTRVPTESRPGHVALIAGMYEDPSAVYTGWKINPVGFDTLFNQSNMAWCWGSPDIMNLFKFSDMRDNVAFFSYDAEFEDFSGSRSTAVLDNWVFTKFEEFMQERSGRQECEEFCDKGNVFFLHLLGMDSAGHVFKPNSAEFSYTLTNMDRGVKTVVKLVNKFFSDGKTAFIFTADHGMTNWGSHGSGSIHETQTPIIAWGAGIKKGLTRDVNQADILPLMSTLIGKPIPMNSMGVLPTEYLDMEQKDIFEALYTNAMQLLAQFNVKHQELSKHSFKLVFNPYLPLTDDNLILKLNNIQNYKNKGDYENAIKNTKEFIEYVIKGLKYYQNYHQYLLLSCTVLGTIFWMIHLIAELNNINLKNYIGNLNYNESYYKKVQYRANVFATIILLIVTLLMYLQNMAINSYLYVTYPIWTGWNLIYNSKSLYKLINVVNKTGIRKIFYQSFVYVVGLELLVFSFFNRMYMSIAVAFISIWSRNIQTNSVLKNCFTGTSFILIIFPLMNVMGEKFNWSCINASVLFWAITFVLTFNKDLCRLKMENKRCTLVYTIQIILCVIAFFNTLMVQETVSKGMDIIWFNQILSWCILLLAFIVPLYGSIYVISRLLHILVGLLAPYILLAVKQELFFLLALSINLVLWMLMEHYSQYSNVKMILRHIFRSQMHPDKPLNKTDFRQAFFYVYFIMLSFFGTGNVASLNSFDPACVRTFISIFNPFPMMVLMLIKILIPFLVTTVVFYSIVLITKSIVFKVFFVMLLYCEFMTLHFLFKVKNEGSWLDIGESISHFAIMNFITVFLLILFMIGKGLTMYTFVSFAKLKHNQQKSF